MKIMHTADLHVDITQNNLKLVDYIIEYLRVEQPDVFVVAGDIANSSGILNGTLQRFSKIDCLKCFIPGNHDIWFDSKSKLHKGFDSSFKYEVALKEISEKNDFIYPVFEPFIFNDFAIAGSIGWYDYSLADVRLKGKFNVTDYQYGRFGNTIWADVEYAIWLKDRQQKDWRLKEKKLNNGCIFNKVIDIFKTTISKIPQIVSKYLIVLHTAPYTDCIIPKDEPDPFDAYEGSVRYGEFLSNLAEDKNITVICGHRHKELNLQIGKNISLFRSPVGYLTEKVDNFEKLAMEKVGIINI